MNVGKNTIVYLLSPRQLIFELTDVTVRSVLGPKSSTVQIYELKTGEVPSCYDFLVVDLYPKHESKRYSEYVSHYLAELSLLRVPVLFVTPQASFRDELEDIGLSNFHSADASNYLEHLEHLLTEHKREVEVAYKIDRRMSPTFQVH